MVPACLRAATVARRGHGVRGPLFRRHTTPSRPAAAGPRKNRRPTSRPAPACESRRWSGSGPTWSWRTDQVKSGTPDARLEAQQILKYWQHDAALAGVRDKTELSKLPEDERAAWGNFWAQVDALLEKLTFQVNSPSR